MHKFLVSKTKYTGNIKESVQKAVEPLGGFSNFIKTGDVVLLKPNYNTADPFPASTNLDFLKAVIELVYEQNPKLIIIGESSTYTLNTRKVLEKTGALKLAQELNTKIWIFDEREWVKKEITQGKYLKKVSVPEILDRIDKLILLPCLKTHRYSRFTGALKLSVGFIKPSERVRLHLMHLEPKIAELNTIIHPNLIITDGRKCFVTAGPEYGDTREPNLIFASNDRVALDVEAVKILKSYKAKNKLDMPIWELPQIARAVELGFGAKSEEDYRIVET